MYMDNEYTVTTAIAGQEINDLSEEKLSKKSV